MKKYRKVIHCIGVILGYLILLEVSKLIEFWIFMSKQSLEELASLQWSWISRKESWFFYAPFGTGLFRVMVIAAILCLLVYGKDFRWGKIKHFPQSIRACWKSLLVQEAAIVGVGLGISYTRGIDRFFSLISLNDLYYFLSGTTALKIKNISDMQSDMLWAVSQRFEVLTRFDGMDLWLMPIAYLIYELLKICFWDGKKEAVT